MKTVFIYALCEPETRIIRYIGKTKNPKRRLRSHCTQSPKVSNYLGRWMASIACFPSLLILREVPESEWQEWEQRYIRCARALGFKLVNGTDGGDGMYNPTEETLRRMSINHADVSGEKNPNFGKGMKGVKHPFFGKPTWLKGKFKNQHPKFGKKESMETRAKKSLARKQYWETRKQKEFLCPAKILT